MTITKSGPQVALAPPRSQMTNQSRAPMPFFIASHMFNTGREAIPFILIKPKKSHPRYGMQLGFALSCCFCLYVALAVSAVGVRRSPGERRVSRRCLEQGQRTDSGRTPHLLRRQLKVLLCSSHASACRVPRMGTGSLHCRSSERAPAPTPPRGCSHDSQVSSVGKLRSKKDKGVVPQLSSPLLVTAQAGTLRSSDPISITGLLVQPPSQQPP